MPLALEMSGCRLVSDCLFEFHADYPWKNVQCWFSVLLHRVQIIIFLSLLLNSTRIACRFPLVNSGFGSTVLYLIHSHSLNYLRLRSSHSIEFKHKNLVCTVTATMPHNPNGIDCMKLTRILCGENNQNRRAQSATTP